MFESELLLKELVHKWTDCSLPGPEFTHTAHIAVSSFIAWHHTLPDTYSRMKIGLYRFNEANGTPNSDTRGYHETLTRFWCTLLFHHIHTGQFPGCLDATNAMIALYGSQKRAERPYYSFDVLTSVRARKEWIAPDVRGPIALTVFEWQGL
jgi:hypothetical protein